MHSIRTPLGVLIVLWTAMTDVAAQPSVTADRTVVLPAAGASSARGGANTTFGSSVFDAIDQPALGAWHGSIGAEVSWQFERDVDDTVPWAVGVILPLGDASPALPTFSVAHRHLRRDTVTLGPSGPLAATANVDVEHDLTSLALAWDLGSRWAVGAALHTVSKPGFRRLAFSVATFDTVITADDLLFAGSIGAVHRVSPRPLGAGRLEWRTGAALRRWGEDVDLGRTAFRGRDLPWVRRSALAAEVAVGTGLQWATRRVSVEGIADVAWPIHDGAPAGPRFAGGVELAWADALYVRAGVRDDHVDTALTLGAGLRTSLPGGLALGVHVAREPSRAPQLQPDDATVLHVRLEFPLPGAPDDEEGTLEDLFDDLDRLDDWIETDSPDSTSRQEWSP